MPQVKKGLPWTKRWLEILKGEVMRDGRRASLRERTMRRSNSTRRGTIAGSLGGDGGAGGGMSAMPPFGFGDAVSYSFIEHAVSYLHLTGAVRHGEAAGTQTMASAVHLFLALN